METKAFERMMAAEMRMIMNERTDMLEKVKELKRKYAMLYRMGEEKFAEIVSFALALNIRDGHCNKIPTMP